MATFVVRDTFHPAEDIARNWSSFAGGWDHELGGYSFATEEEAAREDMKVTCDKRREYRFHPAHDGFVAVHYEGLGAYQLAAETLEKALVEAANIEEGLAVTMEAGDGHFYAEDVMSFHEVRPGRWIFELK